MFKVMLEPDKLEFDVNDNETILEAGLRHKLNLSYSCKNGVCGACKTKIIDGQVTLNEYNQQTLNHDEQLQGYTLLCKAHPQTDVVLNLPNALSNFAIKIIPAKVLDIRKIHNIAIVRMKLATKFEFHPGQYIEIMFQGKTRIYSIANIPMDNNEIEIHIKYHTGGIFSEYVWHELAIGSLMRFKGPLGSFRLQNSHNPIIAICTGTGFAPIKSLIESLYNSNSQRCIHLYWGNRQASDFYDLDVLQQWQQRINITIVLCLSQTPADGYFSGYVVDALLQDHSNLSNYEVYACGNSKMIESVFSITSQKLFLNKQNFFSDAFIASSI